jgi:hypothetical protein
LRSANAALLKGASTLMPRTVALRSLSGERVAKGAQLLLADAGEGGREEREDHGLAAQAGERDALALVLEEGEVGGGAPPRS